MEARELRRQAKELQTNTIKAMRQAIDKLTPDRRAELGRLEPNPPAAAPSPLPLPAPLRPSALPWTKVFVRLFLEEDAFAVTLGMTEAPSGPFRFDHGRVSIQQSMDQLNLQRSFVNALSGVAGNLFRPEGDARRIITYTGGTDKSDLQQSVRAVAANHSVDPESTVNVVNLHLRYGIYCASLPSKTCSSSGGGAGGSSASEDVPAGHIANSGSAISDRATVQDSDDIAREFKNDLRISVEKVSAILDGALEGLTKAKGLEDQANIKDQQATNQANNPPKPPAKSGGGNNNKNDQPQQDQGQGNGDGKGDNKDNKGQPLQAAQVPFPGAIPDARGLFDAATRDPITPGVGAVADASKIESLPNPKFEGIGGAVGIPPILRSTASPVLADATSGKPAFPTNLIPGNAVTANALDRSFFENKNDVMGGGGGDKQPSFGGAVTGGTAGSSFGGGDIGAGIGPTYGGRAGLSDALKTVAYGTGGGVNTSESSATINTGADSAFPPQVLAQLTPGKKMKDGPGKGAVGLMGQVFSLVQTQCGDNTQRTKMEDFCGNVTQVAARAQTKAFLANDQPPRRDLASERGAVSSK